MQENVQSNDLALLGQSVEQLLLELPERISSPLWRWRRETPGALALCDHLGHRCTYEALAQRVEQCQAQLRELGVRPGDRVLLLNENCVTVLVWVLALSELDAVSVVVNARLTAQEIDRIQSHCEPRLTVCFLDSAAAGEHWQALSRTTAGLEIEQHGARVGVLRHSKSVPLEQGRDAVQDRVCVMIYTTGTTGDPKGVMLSHRNILYVAAITSVLRGMDPSDRIYCVLPVSHIFGLSAVFLASLYRGAALILADRFDAAGSLQAMREYEATGMLGVPTMFARFIEYARAHGLSSDAMPRLRFLYAGGAPLDATIKRETEALFQLPLLNAYGMTESGPTICQVRWNEPLASCSVGRPLPGLDIRIVDSRGQMVAAGDVGELHVRGPNVMKGYYRNAAATAGVIDQEGFLNTGDLVREDEGGNLHIAGRSKELIIHSGFNVYPPEVEAAIARHPDVLLCAVVGEPADGNELVVAYVQCKLGRTLTAKALQDFIRPALSPYKRPSRIEVLEQLPTAPSGKVLKARLRGLRSDRPPREEVKA